MTIEGELAVTLVCADSRVRDVVIRSTRPHAIGRVVRGQRPDLAVDLITRLHGVCAQAQGAVAATVLDRARDIEPSGAMAAIRRARVAVEAIQEHCTRLGLDWAQAMQEPPLVAMVREVRALAAAALRGLDETWSREGSDRGPLDEVRAHVADLARVHLLGMSCREWLEQHSLGALDRWVSRTNAPAARWYARLAFERPRLGASGVGCLPTESVEFLATELLSDLRGEGFHRLPTWRGVPMETGALARMTIHPLVAAALHAHGNTVATRLLARLSELAALVTGALDEDSGPVATGRGAEACAAAHTARGLLVHRAVLDHDTVAEYTIVAPTEWNFHPEGAFARAMVGAQAIDEGALVADARLLAQALDPCVACTIGVGHA